jgi:hypothetical protein
MFFISDTHTHIHTHTVDHTVSLTVGMVTEGQNYHLIAFLRMMRAE